MTGVLNELEQQEESHKALIVVPKKNVEEGRPKDEPNEQPPAQPTAHIEE